MTYEEMYTAMTQNPATSYWLRDAAQSLSGRDCCDAANDVDSLRVLCELRIDACFRKTVATSQPAN
jgi:hypothetical protein